MKQNRMFVFWLSLLALIGPVLLHDNAYTSDQLQIKIWSEKQQFLVREPIFINYQIKNTSDSVITLAFEEIIQNFCVEGLNGERHGFVVVDFFYSDTLKPNQSHYDPEKSYVDVVGLYGVDDDSIFYYFPEGDYSLYVKMPEDFPFWGVKSNVLKIEVKAPEGEEREAMQIYIEARKAHKDGELALNRYLELVNTYPRSVYAASSLRAALNYASTIEDRGQITLACKKLIEDYPDSRYMGTAFLYLVENYRVLEDRAGVIEYLRQLIKGYPNTRVSERAEYWLEKTKKWEF
jgi:hypothetical protein